MGGSFALFLLLKVLESTVINVLQKQHLRTFETEHPER